MQVLTNVVNFFLGLGAPIFVPIIMIVGSILVGMKIKDAISSGITLGVAFTGMNLLISFMKDSITPAAQAIMTAQRVDPGLKLLLYILNSFIGLWFYDPKYPLFGLVVQPIFKGNVIKIT